MWTNYHTHSNYCDGKGELNDFGEKAVAINMIALGLSSHAPLPFPNKWSMKPHDLERYLADVQRIRQAFPPVEIYVGLEVDYIPGVISPADFAPRLDYTIGSIHFVDVFADGTRWEIDGLHTHFLDGFERIFRNDIREVMARYYGLTREMIVSSRPTVVGHLDKIKIQNIDEKLFRETDSWYRDEVMKTLDVIAQYECIVEVNTRGLYQKKSKTTYPSPWILELLQARNIPVTISSDAHHPDDLTNEFSAAAGLLSRIGFKKITILQEGRWQARSFHEHGIVT